MRDFIKAVRDYVARHATQPAAKAVIDEAEKLLENGIPQLGGSMGGSAALSSLLLDVKNDVEDITADVAALKAKQFDVAELVKTVKDLARTVADVEAELAALKKKAPANPTA